jgi:capsular polysaccharide biosynthesis protein
MQSSSFQLENALKAIRQRWKTIFLFTLLAGFVATITVFLVPKYYRSTSLVVSANTVLADKARLFNNQIQSLYNYYGSGDDLDRIYGIADMDTTYLQLVDSFSLLDYYKLENDSLPVLRKKAVKKLREDLTIRKTDQGQLAFTAWTKDKQLSARLVNQMVKLIEEKEQQIWLSNYHRTETEIKHSLAGLENEYRQLSDSFPSPDKGKNNLLTLRLQTLATQISEYRKKADEFQLAAATPPDVLYVMEPATPAAQAERPDKPAIILAALLAGLLFRILWVLVAERKPML